MSTAFLSPHKGKMEGKDAPKQRRMPENPGLLSDDNKAMGN